MLFNNWAEFQLLVDRLPVFYKQRGFADPCMLVRCPALHLCRPHMHLQRTTYISVRYCFL